MKKFMAELSDDQKQKVEVESSSGVYKFSGGEIRPSKCLVTLKAQNDIFGSGLIWNRKIKARTLLIFGW